MPEYSLELDESEVARYGFMARAALAEESTEWEQAVAPGATVADVGCGPGAVSMVLAEVVGPGGRVVGVDGNPQAVAVARSSAADSGITNADFRVGDAAETGLDAGAFDVVMMRHVLAHNGGREQAIVDHLASLVRPGGCLHLVDVEATAMRTRPSPSDPDLDDLNRRYLELLVARGNDISVGLRLDQLLVDAGLELIDRRGRYHIIDAMPGLRPPAWAARESLVAAGLAKPDDVDRWGAAFERLDAGAIRFTIFLPAFSATGRRT